MQDYRVCFLGDTFLIPHEVKEYNKFYYWFQPFYLKALEPLNTILYSTKDEWKAIDWRSEYTPIAREIIQELSKRDIYDITVSDLIDKNDGFIQLENINEECNKLANSILRKAFDDYTSQYQNAYNRASSRIVGTGTSVYTADPLAYLVFANRETNAVNRQLAQAKIEYNKAIDRLNKSSNDYIAKHMNELRLKQYWPACANAINAFSQSIFTSYIESLNRAGIFNYDAIRHYNLSRSNEILNNIDLVDGKESLLQEAFKVCPYNENIFAKAIETGVVDDKFISAMKILGYKVSKQAMINACKKMNVQDDIKSVIKSISAEFFVPEKEIAYEALSDIVQQISDSFLEIKTLLKEDKELNAWIQERLSTDAETFSKIGSSLISERTRKYVSERLPLDELSQLVENELELPEFQNCSDVDKIRRVTEKKLHDRIIQYQCKIKEYVDKYTLELVSLEEEELARKNQTQNYIIEIKCCESKKEMASFFEISKKRELNKRIKTLNRELQSCNTENELQKIENRRNELTKELHSLLCLPDRLKKKKTTTEIEVKKFYD